jgi:glycine cleavage system H lipoate-binding protein
MAHFIFMGAFFTVLTIVATTLLFALWRSRRALSANQAEEIRWHSDFHDLAPADRACRHVLTGEFKHRECPNAFDCRGCRTHAKLLAKHPLAAAAGREGEIFGMPFPLDRFYHRGHTWARLEPDGLLTIGLDELGRRLVGTPDAVDLPRPGTQLRTNGTAFRMRRRGADVRILSPVDGEVVATGGAEMGWYLRVRPANLDLTHLLRGAEVRPWLMRELERLQLALAAEGACAPALADGGVPVEDIAAAYPATDWDAVCGEMFLEP